jgi:hypothetical protein
MVKSRIITVQDNDISVISIGNKDYISLTEMIKNEEGNDLIRNWMRNRNTLEYLGAWEQLYNPNFKGVEFDTFRNEAGLNSFNMTPKKWIESTDAIGIVSKAGKGGGTFAHIEIALEFGAWISPIFKLYVNKEYLRLKEVENDLYNLEWDVKRVLTKVNHTIHTDAVQKYIIPKSTLPINMQGIEYANEIDLLNLALYGYTAKQWRDANVELSKGKNMRDFSSINELLVMSNLEVMNSEMIKLNTDKKTRFQLLSKMAKEQLEQLLKVDIIKSVRKQSSNTYIEAKNLTGEEIEEESKKSILDINKENLLKFNKSLKKE